MNEPGAHTRTAHDNAGATSRVGGAQERGRGGGQGVIRRGLDSLARL